MATFSRAAAGPAAKVPAQILYSTQQQRQQGMLAARAHYSISGFQPSRRCAPVTTSTGQVSTGRFCATTDPQPGRRGRFASCIAEAKKGSAIGGKSSRDKHQGQQREDVAFLFKQLKRFRQHQPINDYWYVPLALFTFTCKLYYRTKYLYVPRMRNAWHATCCGETSYGLSL